MAERISHVKRVKQLVLIGGISAAIFLFDTFSNVEVSIATLYVLVVILAGNALHERGALIAGVACTLLTLLSFLIQHGPVLDSSATGRCAVALLAIAAATIVAIGMQRVVRNVREQAELLELTRDAIFVRDIREGRDQISFWNAGAEALYGWTREDAIGRRISDLLPAVYSTTPASVRRQLEAAGHWYGELLHKRRDGTDLWVDSRWTLQYDEHGVPLAILQIDSDITEQKKSEDALENARRELSHVARISTLGELAASIAHEVRQPVSAVLIDGDACLRWMRRDVPDMEQAGASVERMIANARRTEDVVKRLRALATRSKGETSLFSLNEIVSDVLPLVERERLAHDVKLDLALTESLDPVSGDRIQLQQVLLNLVVNAIQAMAPVTDRQRTLFIRSDVGPFPNFEEACAVLEVRDTGPGIDESTKSQIFMPFFTTKSQGMGMGLSICRSILEWHGGHIDVVPDISPGTAFVMAIPVHGAQNDEAMTEAAGSGGGFNAILA